MLEAAARAKAAAVRRTRDAGQGTMGDAGTGMTERKSHFLFDDLLACARGELFGPGNAQLPLPPMLMFDRITHISEEGGEYGKGKVVAELDVKPDLWFFRCHFPGDPVSL